MTVHQSSVSFVASPNDEGTEPFSFIRFTLHGLSLLTCRTPCYFSLPLPSSICILAFLIPTLHVQTASLYFSLATHHCFCCLYFSFSFLSLSVTSRFLLSLASFLLSLYFSY